MRGISRCCMVLGVLLAGAAAPAPVRADEPPADADAWHAAVAHAAAAFDRAALTGLARAPRGDAWIATDRMVARGFVQMADHFASQVAAPDAEALRRYFRGEPEPRRVERAVLDQIRQRLEGGDALGAARAAAKHGDGLPDLLRYRFRFIEAWAWRFAGELDAARSAFEAAETIATRLGWLQAMLDSVTGLFETVAYADRAAAEAALVRRGQTAAKLGEPVVVLETQVWRGGVEAESGRITAGVQRLRAALAELTVHQKDEYTGEAHATLAQALVMGGQYGLALNHGAEAARCFERAEHVEGALYARASIIAAYSDIGLDESVARLCKVQVAQAQGVDAQLLADARLAWAISAARLGDADLAAAKFAEALAYFDAHDDHRQSAILRINRASELHMPIEDWEAAARDLAHVLESEAMSRRLQGYAHLFLGDVHAARGDDEASGDAYQRAERAATETGDRTLKAIALAGLSERAFDRDATEALDLAVRASAEILAEADHLADTEAVSFLGQAAPVRAAAARLRAAFAIGDPAIAFDTIEAVRAVALLDSLGGVGQVYRAALPDELRIALEQAQRRLRDAEAAHDAELAGDGNLKRLARVRAERQTARTVLTETQSRLQREAARIARVSRPAFVSHDALRAWLAPHEVFVHYAVVDASLHAVVVDRAGVRLLSIGAAAAALASVSVLDTYRRPRRAGENERKPATVFRSLANELLGPLELAPTVTNVIVSPSAEIANLPWPKIGRHADVALTLAPSASVLMLLSNDPVRVTRKRLVLADPDYTGRSRLSPLPRSGDEGRAVARETDELRLGAEASESTLRDVLHGRDEAWSVVHFACHGIVNREWPALSSLALAQDAGHDGFLTGAEILALPLDADLVVLSACDTGTMTAVAGEGYLGVPRALLAAGASRILANLWRVDDRAGMELMRLFYAALEAGAMPIEALRSAQEELPAIDAKWADPYYWAGWVCWGSPR